MVDPSHPLFAPTAEAAPSRRERWGFVLLLVGLLLGLSVLWALRVPHAEEALTAALEVLPIATLGLLAAAARYRAVSLVGAVMIYGIVLFGIVLLPAGMGLMVGQAAQEATDAGRMNPDALWFASEAGQAQLFLLGYWSLLSGLMALTLLLPPVRRSLAAVLPFDPNSPGHVLALSLITAAMVSLTGVLIGLASRPPLLMQIQMDPTAGESMAESSLPLNMLLSLAWTILGTVMVVGFPATRSLRAAFGRLGLVRPTWKQVTAGVVVAAGMVAFGHYALDPAVGYLWSRFRWPMTDTSSFEQILAPAMTVVGSLVLGLTAGVGEELMIRGVLQPRFGILLPNLFFTSLHAMQYGFDGLLSVFVVGTVLGVVRSRSNTTTCCIVHGVYDIILMLMSLPAR